MKCLLKYHWVKLPRNQMPPGKGIMGSWARLASRSAFRSGQAVYCGHINQVALGCWVGGVVGLKSILGIRSRSKALDTMERLSSLDYIAFDLNGKSKKLTYQIKDWVVSCSGAPCMGTEAIYATSGYGFLCLPRSITQRLVETHHQFEEADAWLDLWCHTVWQEPSNAFSYLAPAVQYGRHGAILTLESLGRRWGWEKTKVWRFFKKHADAFPLYKLPGSYGCLIFNAGYPTGLSISLPEPLQIKRILEEIRIHGTNTHFKGGNDRSRMACWIAWYSRKVLPAPVEPGPCSAAKGRVALSGCLITRAYFSSCRHCRSFGEDCRGNGEHTPAKTGILPRDGPDFVPAHDMGGIEYGRFEGDPLW